MQGLETINHLKNSIDQGLAGSIVQVTQRLPSAKMGGVIGITSWAFQGTLPATGQMMKRPGYLGEFLEFWAPRPEIKKVWFSLFTPQVGDQLPEMLMPAERALAISEMKKLRKHISTNYFA